MKYRVALVKSDQGYSVHCPALPGCWSQGKNREEALANIRKAMRLWLEVAEEDALREAEGQEAALEEVSL